MQKINLYIYEEPNGMIIVTPNRRNETDTPNQMRLIADENAILTDGITETPARDVMLDEIDKWYEIGSTIETTESNYISILNEKEQIIDILTGVSE